MTVTWTLFVGVSYLLGAIPTAFIVARAKGVDIRQVGSGNVGATNVFRSVGKGWGIFTFAMDAMKGFVPAWVFPRVALSWLGYAGGPELGLACAAAAVAGHNWPIYLRFKGGKGVATSAGALIGIAPLAALVGVVAWLAIFLPTRYVSLSSMVAAVAVCALAWFHCYGKGLALPVAFTLLAALLLWRHRSNIARLAQGKETKIQLGRKPEA